MSDISLATGKGGYFERTDQFRKGWFDALHRIKGLTKGERSPDEWRALLMVFRWATRALERKVQDCAKPKLRVVE